MGLSIGWLLLLGGLLGAIRVLRAKTFSWINEVDTVVTEKNKSQMTPMASSKRWALVTVCLLSAVVGLVLVYRQHA